ncbi:btb/poz domain-containing [Anaeramoeba flamelloides]|uniref:Btb/poz domain-containing n=1 Tax=Anaeramoeba flamelloides TaxID=1746091 RepID=A0ABQ8Y7F3_9EUKA|nr:btb/poz domain-containing [Anaeramoeba flamelloides]
MSQALDEILLGYVNNKEFADVKFVVGKKKAIFYAHKFFLSLVSAYWRNVLYSKGWETRRTRSLTEIYLPDLEPRIFLSFLQFVYTRSVKIKGNLVFELLDIAKKYGIEELFKYCDESFQKSLSNENCIKYYEYSCQNKLEKWKAISSGYIEDHSGEIMKNHFCLIESTKETVLSILNLEKLYAFEIDIVKSLIYWSRSQKRKYYQSNEKVQLKDILIEFKPLIKLEFLDFDGLEQVSDIGLYSPTIIFGAMMKLTQKYKVKVRPLTRAGAGIEDLKVLLLANCRRGHERIEHIRESVMTTGIQNVDIMNCSSQAPSFDEMFKYDCVVVRNRNAENLHNQVELGNDLARYVEAGKGVVIIAINTLIDNDTCRIKGRLQDEEFIPLQFGERIQQDSRELGEVLLPEHEIMTDVNSFKTKNYAQLIGTHDVRGGTIIAKWSNGFPLITEKTKEENFGTVVCLNFHPCSSKITNDCGKVWLENTDGDKIIANSVSYVGMKLYKRVKPQRKQRKL